MIALEKKTGINLKKGNSISLEKDGRNLQKVCFGLNWGAIQRKGLLSGWLKSTESVDLDGAITTFAGQNVKETIFFNHLTSKDGSIVHSGDDLTGDLSGDDGLDNEVITIDLRKVSSEVDTLYIYLNSYKGQDFGEIPYSKLRIFEGSQSHIDDVLATFNLSTEPKFRGFVSMLMGKLVRTSKGWDFKTIGQPLKSGSIADIEWFLKNKIHPNR